MRTRALTDAEILYADEVFCGAVDYRLVRITRESLFAHFSATTVCNAINLQAGHFLANTLGLSEQGKLVLIHELAHVWQYQHSGIGYALSSLSAQFCAWLSTGSRHAAYNWQAALRQGIPWSRWNAEQQAQCFSDYNRALRGLDTNADPPSFEATAILGAALVSTGARLPGHAASITSTEASQS